MHKWFTLLPVALIAALVLASCGSDSGNESSPSGQSAATATDTTPNTTDASGGGDEDQIKRTITDTITNPSPRHCTELETPHYVQQIYFGFNVENSIAICRLASPALAATSVKVTGVEVDGETATAKVAVKGAVYDGQVLAVTLTKEGDQWKMASLDDFVDFDSDHFAVAFATTHREAGDLHPDQVACVTKKLKAVPTDEMKAIMLAGKPHRLGGKFQVCLKNPNA